jgi:radical SAM protein with 4Fe4S-binding SPASM domain
MNKIRSQIIIDTAKHKKYITPCYAGKVAGVMMANGDVFPCELLNRKMGNVKDYRYDFKKLWKSKQAKAIADHITDSKCFCTHECFHTANIVFNPKLLTRVLLNKNLKK